MPGAGCLYVFPLFVQGSFAGPARVDRWRTFALEGIARVHATVVACQVAYARLGWVRLNESIRIPLIEYPPTHQRPTS